MILGDTKIKNYISKLSMIENFEPSQIEPASVDLRLGNTWLMPCRMDQAWVELGGAYKYSRFESNSKIIGPGEFLLATTMEKVNLPTNVAAFVQGRSSIGRIGLTVQNAGFVDPGFCGHITLELVNESPNHILLTAGYRVAQLVFFETDGVSAPYKGKYNGQIEATGSRMQLDR